MRRRAPASWTIFVISSSGCRAPVEVSAWMRPTTLGFDALTASAICCGSKTSPKGRSIFVTSAPRAAGDVRHPSAEDAVDSDEHAVAGLDEVDDAGFHAGAAGAADGHRQLVPGAEDLPEHGLGFVHDH